MLTDVHEDTPLEGGRRGRRRHPDAGVPVPADQFHPQPRRSQGKPVNIKKGQFLSPWEMKQVVEKARSTGNQQIMVCERGFSFGYNNLVVDMRGLAVMRDTGCPVVFDATHSVQLPGGQGTALRRRSASTSRCWRARRSAAGVSGVFMETHPKPDEALCDGPNSWPLAPDAGTARDAGRSWIDWSRRKAFVENEGENDNELHRRRRGKGNPRLARQSDGRGGRAARVGRDGARRGALGRLDRQPRGDRAARRRRSAATAARAC